MSRPSITEVGLISSPERELLIKYLSQVSMLLNPSEELYKCQLQQRLNEVTLLGQSEDTPQSRGTLDVRS